jgi:hypothetical protein
VSDGGKNICNWEALFSPRPAELPGTGVEAPPRDAPCVIYSFGISRETSFEEEMMKRLEGSGCRLYGFDPTVPRFPSVRAGGLASSPLQTDTRDMNAPDAIRNSAFAQTGLVGESDVEVSQAKWADAGTLSMIMKKNGHAWVDILKVDIEGSEWHLFEDEWCTNESGKKKGSK